jgi:predicted dehydrogenase
MQHHDQVRIAEEPLSRRTFLHWSGSAALLASGTILTQAGRAHPAGSGGQIRMGVVGGGFGAAFWWHEHPQCVVTGVTDLRPDRRDILRQRYHCDRVYDSFETMVKEADDIDAVATFSGAPDHAQHVKMCFDRGWHAVSAVPTCMTLEEAAMLKELKERTGLKYMLAETSYYRQECILARNLFQEGAFGELFYTENEYYHDLADQYFDRADLSKPLPLDRRYDEGLPPELRRGGHSWRWGFPPMLYPTHSLGYLVGVTGERITKVSCLGWAGSRPELKDHPSRQDNIYQNPFWNQASMMLTDQGHMSRCNVFFICQAGGERAQWFGDRATLYMPNDGVHGAIRNVRGENPAPAVVPEYWKSDMLPEPMRHESGHGGSHVFISAEFINALLEDREPAIDLYEGLAMTVPGIVAHQSSLQEGQQLVVPSFDPS